MTHKDLISAIKKNDLEKVEQCLRQGVDVNAKDRYGNIALTLAASSGNKEVVGLLLKKGADVNAKDEKNCNTALTLAAFFGHKNVVGLLLEKGADVNAKDEDGATALMEAAYSSGNKEVVGLLLEKGADIHAKNKYGRTALMVAEARENKAVVEFIKEWEEKAQDSARKETSSSVRKSSPLSPIFRQEAREALQTIRETARQGLKPILEKAVRDGKSSKEALEIAKMAFPALKRAARISLREGRKEKIENIQKRFQSLR